VLKNSISAECNNSFKRGTIHLRAQLCFLELAGHNSDIPCYPLLTCGMLDMRQFLPSWSNSVHRSTISFGLCNKCLPNIELSDPESRYVDDIVFSGSSSLTLRPNSPRFQFGMLLPACPRWGNISLVVRKLRNLSVSAGGRCRPVEPRGGADEKRRAELWEWCEPGSRGRRLPLPPKVCWTH